MLYGHTLSRAKAVPYCTAHRVLQREALDVGTVHDAADDVHPPAVHGRQRLGGVGAQHHNLHTHTHTETTHPVAQSHARAMKHRVHVHVQVWLNEQVLPWSTAPPGLPAAPQSHEWYTHG